VDHLVQFGNVTITKGKFWPVLVAAHKATYTPKNILSAWRSGGLILHNPRHVLDKLTLGQEITPKAAPSDSVEPPTPRNTVEIHRKVRQATLQLRSKDSELSLAGLLDVIHWLEKFAIAADQDRAPEHAAFLQWTETA